MVLGKLATGMLTFCCQAALFSLVKSKVAPQAAQNTGLTFTQTVGATLAWNCLSHPISTMRSIGDGFKGVTFALVGTTPGAAALQRTTTEMVGSMQQQISVLAENADAVEIANSALNNSIEAMSQAISNMQDQAYRASVQQRNAMVGCLIFPIVFFVGLNLLKCQTCPPSVSSIPNFSENVDLLKKLIKDELAEHKIQAIEVITALKKPSEGAIIAVSLTHLVVSSCVVLLVVVIYLVYSTARKRTELENLMRIQKQAKYLDN